MADTGMEKILARAREMQAKHNRQLAETEVEASVADGKVRGKMNGHRSLTSVQVAPDLITPENVEELERAVAELVNDLVNQMDKVLENRFGIIDKMPSLSMEHIFGQ